jgi:WD40 repeat protein
VSTDTQCQMARLTKRHLLAYLALGSASGSIFLFDSGNRSEVPDRQLDGHSLNVCALDTDDGTTMISGSWDK